MKMKAIIVIDSTQNTFIIILVFFFSVHAWIRLQIVCVLKYETKQNLKKVRNSRLA